MERNNVAVADTQIVYRCTPRQLRTLIIECFEAGLVPYVRGSPGIGKSAIFRAICRDLQLWMIDHRLSTSDPTDLNGLPHFKDGLAQFAPFRELFPLEDTPIPAGYQGWLVFFDEANSASKQTQAASYKTVLDKMVGQRKLHPNVLIAMAGNLDTDRAITNPISTAMESRTIHFELYVDFDDWELDVALAEDYDSRIISFLRQNRSLLMDFKPDHEGKTFCCPRTWEFMNRLIYGKEVTSDRAPLYAGTISSGVAVKFAEYCQIHKKLITAPEILKDPLECRLPDENPIKWATVSTMTEHVNDNTFTGLSQYANRFSLDFRVLFYRSVMVKHKNKFRHHPAFQQAAVELSRYLNG